MKKAWLFFAVFLICETIFSQELKVNIVPGKMWEKRTPQCAVWICDSNGEYIDTLYVTESAAKKSWKFSPKNGRPDSLPVWYFSSKCNPSSPAEKFDAVSSPTPKKSITISKHLNLEKGKKYFVMSEVNQSFDYNDFFTKANSGVNGQPSVVYSEEFILENEPFEIELTFSGNGSIDGSNGNISKDEEKKLTTAKDIIAHIFVVIE